MRYEVVIVSSPVEKAESLRKRKSAPTKKVSPVSPRPTLEPSISSLPALDIWNATTPTSVGPEKIGVAMKLAGAPPTGSLEPELEALRLAAGDAAFAAVAWTTALLSAIAAAIAWVTTPGRDPRSEKPAGLEE